MGGGGNSAPQRNLYQETSDELQARLDLAPEIYAAEASYGPMYQGLQLSQLEALMNGTPGGTTTTPYSQRVTQAGYYDASGNLVGTDRMQYFTPGTTAGGRGNTFFGVPVPGPGGAAGGAWNIPEGVRWVGRGGTVNGTRTSTTAASPGLLALLEGWAPRLAEIDAAQLSTQREADIADVARLGGSSREAMDLADPQTAELMRMLTESASTDLALGSRLTPEQERTITRQTMAGAGARGWGYNPGDLARTAIATTDYGQQLEDRRRQYAAGITGLRSSYYGSGFDRVLGRPASSTPQSWYGTAMGGVQSAAPRLFGSSIDANDVFNTNYNARVSSQNAAANNNAAMTGAGISALGLIGAALI